MDLVKDALIGGTLVRVGQKAIHILGGIEFLVAFACVYRHRVVIGCLGALGVVLVRNGKQSHLGKGTAGLDDADQLAVGTRHVFVQVDVLVSCDKGIDAVELRGKGLGVERVRDADNDVTALNLAQSLCLGIDGAGGAREAGARHQVRAQRGTQRLIHGAHDADFDLVVERGGALVVLPGPVERLGEA